MKTWTEISFSGSAEALEGAANRAFEIGASGVEETDGGIRLFFPEGPSPDEILRSLSDYARSLREMGFSLSDPVPRPVPEEDWGLAWQAYFKPTRVGNRFVVKPPWENWTAGPDDLVIDISPKMAFGTGSHETTRLCVGMLERHLKPGMTVLDVGTGSGILAIAALRLGAASASGLDVEEESVENAAENAALNGVADRFAVRLGSVDVLSEGMNGNVRENGRPIALSLSKRDRSEAESNRFGHPSFDLILANIDRRTLVPMIPGFTRFAKPGTVLILSGILIEEQGAVLDLIEKPPFRLLEKQEMKEWAGFAAVIEEPASSGEPGGAS
ncbi:MAG: 50S ribosomal protein L11 methyltransferase [bacterium]|nr:50S ribosomal protein L11 methyltransferase [bacterium]